MNYSAILIIFFCLCACKDRTLPILGHREIIEGKTIYSEVPQFELLNQDSTLVNLKTFTNKIHLACFFFTSCPTICPKVMRSMIRIEQEFGSENIIAYTCFSIDHKKDTPHRLKQYQSKLGIDNPNFHFLHIPNQTEVKRISEKYMSTALEDPYSPGGFDHSGWILLVDKNKHLRAYAAGTDEDEVSRLMDDVKILLREK